MRLFVAVDLEGVCAVVSEADTGREGAAAAAARQEMRSDLDAVLDGCLAAGAGHVIVCDAHDDGASLDPSGLPAQGLEAGQDGALFVGYHARAGTAAAVLEHTWSERIFSVHVGSLEVGEFGLAALLAGSFGVPALYLSGDDKVCAEAQALVPGIVTTIVKTGIGRTCAAYCRPEEARARMRDDAERATGLRRRPAPLMWSGEPLRLTFTHVRFCDLAAAVPAVARIDGRTIEMTGSTFEEVYRSFLACLHLSAAEG
jgi:D-amino peptidase